MARVVYTSDARAPVGELISPRRILAHLLKHRELILTFARRDFQAAHRGTYLGFAWTVISPLIMLGLFTAVFGGVFRGRFSTSPDETAADFAVALFIGLSLFQCVAQSLGTAPSLVHSNATYVKTLTFPVEIIPVAAVINVLISLAINLAVCLAAFAALNGSFHWTIVFLPLHVLSVTLICLGTTWLVSALAVFVRDVASVIPPLTLVLMFWSLVFFPISAVPESVRWSVQINPLSTIIEQARAALMYGTVPDMGPLSAVLLVSALFAIAGYYFFMRAKPAFADVL